MAIPTLESLINPKSSDVIKAELINLLQANGFDATDWNSGSESRTLLEVESFTLSELWNVVTLIAKGMYIDTATGGWLTLLAKSQFQLDRIAAEYTRGVATFSLVPGLGPRTINPGDIIVSDGLGHNFITDNPVPVNLTTLNPSAIIPIISQTTGADNNVAAGSITTINQGPADITVTNLGLPTEAILVTAPITTPINVMGLRLELTTGAVIVFPANYATLNDLINFLNSDVTFTDSTNNTYGGLFASAAGAQLRISSVKKGPSISFTFLSTGTANSLLGISTTSNTRSVGTTSVDTSADIYSAYLSGPFNVLGLTLKGTVTVGGITQTPFTYTFAANYSTLDALVAVLGQNIPGVTATNDGGRLKLSTIQKGAAQGLVIDQTGTANPKLGFSTTLDMVAVGSSAWITQEGRDEESDDSLRARCKARWGILGAGTKDAFLTWAREADPKVQKVVVYADYLNGTAKAGAVTVYIAGLNSGLDAATVLNVYNYILAKMPIMSQLYVGSVTVLPVYVTGQLLIKAGSDGVRLKSEILNNITLYSQSLQIGDTVYTDRIKTEVLRVSSDILTFTMTSPATDIALLKNQIAVVQEDPLNPITILVK